MKFCTKCGSRLSRVKNILDLGFDENTGEKRINEVERDVCMNPNCKIGCSNTGGHDYHGFFLFNKRTCRKCGDIMYYYD